MTQVPIPKIPSIAIWIMVLVVWIVCGISMWRDIKELRRLRKERRKIAKRIAHLQREIEEIERRENREMS